MFYGLKRFRNRFYSSASLFLLSSILVKWYGSVRQPVTWADALALGLPSDSAYSTVTNCFRSLTVVCDAERGTYDTWSE